MIDLKTINENLANAKADVAFWEKARAVFLDPRIAGIEGERLVLAALPEPSPVGTVQPRTYGELKKRVYDALPAWGEAPAGTSKLVAVMERSGYVFASKTPAISVNEALVTLEIEELAFMAVKQGVTRFWTKMQPKVKRINPAHVEVR